MADEADQMIDGMKAMAKTWHAKIKEPDLAQQLKEGVVELAPLVKDLLKIYPEEGDTAPAGKRGKAGPVEAAKAVLAKAKDGTLSQRQLEAFLAAITDLPEGALGKIAEVVGSQPTVEAIIRQLGKVRNQAGRSKGRHGRGRR